MTQQYLQAVRISAGRALVTLYPINFETALATAIRQETDPAVATELRSSLKAATFP
jgi:hypothetical protein